MHCVICGTEILKTDALCKSCGLPVVNVTDQVTTLPDTSATPLHAEDYIPSWAGNVTDDATTQLPISPPPPMSSSHPEHGFGAASNIHEASLDDYRTKKSPSKAIIPIIIVIAAILIGVGVYWFLDFGDGYSIDEPLSPLADEPSILITSPPVQDAEVLSINIIHEGMYVWDIAINEGESFYLSAAIEPFGIEENTIWTSSNPSIFTVDVVNSDGTEALLTGISAGEAVLVITAGNIVRTLTVWVYWDDYWDDFVGDDFIGDGFTTDMLALAISQADLGVQLIVEWSDLQHGGRTIFEREPNSEVWMMHSRDGDFWQVYPSFGFDGYVFTIGFPTTERLYYLYNDGTGNFRHHDWTNNENLLWYFITFTY